MYTNTVEIYYFEDDKTVSFCFHANTVEEVKAHNVNKMVAHAGQQYSMMKSEVVVSSVITGADGEYVDSDEYFCTYTPEKHTRRELALA